MLARFNHKRVLVVGDTQCGLRVGSGRLDLLILHQLIEKDGFRTIFTKTLQLFFVFRENTVRHGQSSCMAPWIQGRYVQIFARGNVHSQ